MNSKNKYLNNEVFILLRWGRRWPTFCFFLIAEVCLLGSVTVTAGNLI
jgi:hypothetical protein